MKSKRAVSQYAFFLAIASFLLCAPHISMAKSIYVNSSTGNDTTGNGSSTNPYATFTKGYSIASTSGDTLNLAGVFSWSNPAETGATSTNNAGFTISKNITIIGQGTSTTFIEGSSTQESQAYANGSVLTIASGTMVTLNNLTVRYGSVEGPIPDGGGGITNDGTLILQNSAVNYNSSFIAAYSSAGGIFCAGNGSTLIISTSTISNNYFGAGYYGSAGVYAEANGDTVTINASTFTDNTTYSTYANSSPYSYAEPSAGLGMRTGHLTITNSTFFDNNTNSYGGALNIDNVTGVITNTTIVGNMASEGASGILYTSDGNSGHTLSIENTLMEDNFSFSAGWNDFYAYDSTSANTITDNGYNIVSSSTNKTWDALGDQTGSSLNLNMFGTFATNGATNGVQTLSLLATSSAIAAGTTTSNSGIVIPTTDERGFYRYGPPPIGAYDYNGTTTSYVNEYWISNINIDANNGTANFTVYPLMSSFATGTLTFSDNVGTYPDGSEGLWVTTLNPDDSLEYLALSVTGVSNSFLTEYESILGNDNPVEGGLRTLTLTNDQGWANPPPIRIYVPPHISSVSSGSPSYSSTTIAWTTDEAATSQVFYGTSTPYTASTTLNSTSSTTHSVALSGLSQGTTYHFQVASVDSASTTGTSSDLTFTTASANTGGGNASTTPSVVYTSAEGGVVSVATLASILAPGPATTAYLKSRGYQVTSTGTVLTSIQPAISTIATSTNSTSLIFTTNLSIGLINPEVFELQRYLNTHGFVVASSGSGSPSNETDTFGSLTKAALIKFQRAQSLPATGYFGPLTRAMIK